MSGAPLPAGFAPTNSPIDAVHLTSSISPDAIRARLDALLTRTFYSGAGYVFESDPHVVEEDDALLQAFAKVREGDRRHAHLLGTVIQNRGGVPQPGVFPWWDLDLNYLTVPTIGRFVLESMREELGLFEVLLAAWPANDPGSKATLAWIHADKVQQVADLAPVMAEALAREAATGKSAIEAVKKARTARLAKEKAAAEAAKKAKAAGAVKPVAGAAKPAAAPAPTAVDLDPNEPGISKKEKGRRAVMRLRAQHGIVTPGATASPAAAAPVAAAAPAGGDLPDPNEPGISPKEKAKRQMLKMRAATAPVATAPAASVAAPTPAVAPAAGAELLDPNEDGISPKEKAKRQMLKMRAAAGAPAAAAAPAAPAPTVTTPSAAPVVEDLGDPDEPGLSPKERARRKVARMRAQQN